MTYDQLLARATDVHLLLDHEASMAADSPDDMSEEDRQIHRDRLAVTSHYIKLLQTIKACQEQQSQHVNDQSQSHMMSLYKLVGLTRE